MKLKGVLSLMKRLLSNQTKGMEKLPVYEQKSRAQSTLGSPRQDELVDFLRNQLLENNGTLKMVREPPASGH